MFLVAIYPIIVIPPKSPTQSLFQYQNDLDIKSALFFKSNVIKSSPEPHDSGVGFSLQFTEPSSTEIENIFTNPPWITPRTPPSKFKWNKPEYRTVNNNLHHASSCLGWSEMSFEDTDDQVNPVANQENLESTHLDSNKGFLTDNWSMRQQSTIGSPMFYDEKANFVIEPSDARHFLRSSPNAMFNSKIMTSIDISPIKCSTAEDMDTDEEST